MIVYRLVCAILMAWAVNWALSRDEADQLLEEIPDMETLGPIAAATIGYFNLAVRQGWGFIVAFANGIWAGVLSILLAGMMEIGFLTAAEIRSDTLKNFESFMTLFGETTQKMLDQIVNIPLLVVSLGATALVGVVTEVIHWVMVRMRGKRKRPDESQG